MYNCLTMC
uniref:Uncharacterized protein n=1 Tax=Anguilla anguilla TaxID=7936 RepID=A0A0E9PYV1_ANGAN